jgi:hypothetical protein
MRGRSPANSGVRSEPSTPMCSDAVALDALGIVVLLSRPVWTTFRLAHSTARQSSIEPRLARASGLTRLTPRPGVRARPETSRPTAPGPSWVASKLVISATQFEPRDAGCAAAPAVEAPRRAMLGLVV